MKKSIYWIIPLLMMFGLGLYGCADSLREGKGEIPSDMTGPEGSEEGEWISYTMEFNASDMITPSLRSLTEKGENDIKGNVRVLVFNTAPDNKFAYEAPVTSVKPTGEKHAAGTVQLLLKNTEARPYRFVMLANLSENTPEASKFAGQTYDEVMKQFTYTMPSDGKWQAGKLPMWGEITAVVNHNEGANPKIGGTIQLIRAVARIDVGLNLTNTGDGASLLNEKAQGLTGITMTSIKFYNMNDKGTVAPASSSLEENSTTKVSVPTLPDAVAALTGALDMSSEIKDSKLLQRSVYVPEAKNETAKATQSGTETLPEADEADYMKRPYMVVGLKGACKNNPTKETFFRIDFLKRDGDEATAKYEYLPLLRNFRYLVNITNVGGPGFDKEEDAQKGPAANIMYNVVVWNESEMSNVKYDGQYMLGVSQDHFKFYRDGGTLTAKVKTSWPKGFTVENLPKWITYTVTPEGAGTETDEKIVTFKVTEHATKDRTYPKRPGDAENPSKAAYVQAGRMRWFLHFEQSKDLNVSISIYSDPDCTKQIEFININQYGEAYGTKADKWMTKDGEKLSSEDAGAKVTFYVKTEPNLEPKISTKNHDKYKIERIENMAGGIWKYTVTAPDVTENDEYFDHIVSNYDFSIKHEETGKTASARLVLQQLEYNAIPYYDEALTDILVDTESEFFYLMNGEERQFYVKANSNYKIHLVSAKSNYVNDDVIEPFVDFIEDEPLLKGKPVKVKTKNDMVNPKLFEGVLEFEISSPSGLFPTRRFKIYVTSAIVQPEANTYMIKAGAKQGILIPVSRVNTAADYYDSLLDDNSKYPDDNTNPMPLPGYSAEPYRLNRLDPKKDNWTVNIVWTDIHDEEKKTKVERAGLRSLGKISDDYIFVQAGKTPGNVLIEIRSDLLAKHNTLWSWHIWIVDEYPKVKEIYADDVKDGLIPSGYAEKVELMTYLIGARRAPKESDDYNHDVESDAWESHGMQYQWGRKDPFPAYHVVEHCSFYDSEEHQFLFASKTKGDRQNKGKENPIESSGSTHTMKASIENPQVIIAHGALWNYEMMPWGNFEYYYKKYVFRFPWNRATKENGLKTDKKGYDLVGGKTVFDPSPYGFRIMSQSEAITLRYAYWRGPNNNSGLISTMPGSHYDGLFWDVGARKRAYYAVAQARNRMAGSYLYNKSGASGGWSPGSNTDDTYNRPFTFSVRPVVDPEHYGLTKDAKDTDYKKYLPDYNVSSEGN